MSDALTVMAAAYTEAALWAGLHFDGREEPCSLADAGYGPDDIAPELADEIRSTCADFRSAAGAMLYRWSPAQAGHDLYLTREYSGTGFWARGLEYGDELTAMAHAYGSHDLYVGDDGRIHS